VQRFISYDANKLFALSHDGKELQKFGLVMLTFDLEIRLDFERLPR